MDEKELLMGLVGKTLNIPNDELASLIYAEDGTLKPDSADVLVSRDAARIQALKDLNKDELTKVHDKGYKKAQAETLAKFEKELKDEFGISESNLVGKELVKEIVSKFAKDNNIDEEKVKVHPKFLELERKLTGEYVPKTDYEKVVSEYDEYKKSFERRQVLQTVKQDAVKVFRSLKPVLSKDPARATNQELEFLEKLTKVDYELQTDGNHIIKVEGKRLETANGHPVSFADFVKSEASKRFDFEVQSDKGNAGNNNSTGSNGGSVTVPRTKEEYILAVTNETDPAKRIALKYAFEASQK